MIGLCDCVWFEFQIRFLFKRKKWKKYPRWIMNIKIVIAVWNLIHFFLFLLNDPSFENFSWNNIISFQVSFSILFIFFFILMNIKSMWSTSSSSKNYETNQKREREERNDGQKNQWTELTPTQTHTGMVLHTERVVEKKRNQ